MGTSESAGSKRSTQVTCIGSLYWETGVSWEDIRVFKPDDEVLVGKLVEEAGGSSLNFARTCRSFGLEPILVAAVGTDSVRKLIECDLTDKGLLFRPIKLEGPSGRSLIIKKAGRSMYISYPGVNLDLTVSHILKAWRGITHSTLVYLSGVPKLSSALEELPDLVNLVHESKGTVALDHGRVPRNAEPRIASLLRDLAKLCDFYFPNENEILHITSSKSIKEALNKSKRIFQNTLVIVKQGERGCTVIRKGKAKHFKTTPILQPRNTVGAGDTFNAAFIWSFRVMRKSLATACNFANQVASSRIINTFDWNEQWHKRPPISTGVND